MVLVTYKCRGVVLYQHQTPHVCNKLHAGLCWVPALCEICSHGLNWLALTRAEWIWHWVSFHSGRAHSRGNWAKQECRGGEIITPTKPLVSSQLLPLMDLLGCPRRCVLSPCESSLGFIPSPFSQTLVSHIANNLPSNLSWHDQLLKEGQLSLDKSNVHWGTID